MVAPPILPFVSALPFSNLTLRRATGASAPELCFEVGMFRDLRFVFGKNGYLCSRSSDCVVNCVAFLKNQAKIFRKQLQNLVFFTEYY